jgi:hypothetical protein
VFDADGTELASRPLAPEAPRTGRVNAGTIQLRLRACDAVEARTGRLLQRRRTAALTATAGGQDRCLMVRASG